MVISNIVRRHVVAIFVLFLLANRASAEQDATTDSDAYRSVALMFATPNDNGIVLLHPGILLDPAFDDDDPQQRYRTASFLNRTMKTNALYGPTDRDFAQLYDTILNTAQWATVPLISQERGELSNLQKLLFVNDGATPTDSYKRYLDSKKAYDEVKSRFDNTPPEQRTAQLQSQLQQARDDLRLKGQENTFRPAAARYALLTKRVRQEWRTTDLANLHSARISLPNGQSFYQTELTPSINSDQLTWTAVTMTRERLLRPVSTPRFAVTVGDGEGWWRWGSSPDPSDGDRLESLGPSDFTLSFEYAFLSVERQWLDWDVFDSQAWRWKEAVISDGSDDRNPGIAPAVATGVILVRNLRLDGDAARAAAARVRTAIRQQESVSFGPFRLVGKSDVPTPVFLPALISASSIRVPFPQVIGFVVRVLPKSPHPNDDFLWSQK